MCNVSRHAAPIPATANPEPSPVTTKRVAQNVSIRIPADWYDLIVPVAAESDAPNLGRWIAQAAVEKAAAERGIPVPVPAPPTRDEVRAAAKALGVTEDQLQARALTELVARLRGERESDIPPPPAKPRSGEYAVSLTPSQGFHALRTGGGKS